MSPQVSQARDWIGRGKLDWARENLIGVRSGNPGTTAARNADALLKSMEK
jgi:hypothetical protein